MSTTTGPGPRRLDSRHISYRGRRLGRRVIALAMFVLGTLNILGALLPPPRRRLASLIGIVPVEVAQTAGTSLVFAGVGLILISRGLRRGYRSALILTLALICLSALLHIFRSLQVLPALIDLTLGGILFQQRSDFTVRSRPDAVRRALWRGAAAGAIAIAISTSLALTLGGNERRGESARAAAERLIGYDNLPFARSQFATPALAALGLAVMAIVIWELFVPRSAPRLTVESRSRDLERARGIVNTNGGGTLDYFALRDDKQWFFNGSDLVAYTVRGGVCLVSPDPICAASRREEIWRKFTEFVHANGWSIAILAAAKEWLPIYKAYGLHTLYIGDEAIVDCTTFTLAKHEMKSLRGAYHRLTRSGCTVSFHDPVQLPAQMQAALLDVAAKTRHGDAERGFSMTLSRLFDPRDTGLLLTVCRDQNGIPIGFIQWIPAAEINGWSLDVMRRDDNPALPNGIIDFMVLETIFHARANGATSVALNFALMRSVLADETPSRSRAVAQYALHRLSERAQIESLWRFNEKYRPEWRPRYVVLDAPEYAATQGLVIIGAEGMDEIPLANRLLPKSGSRR